MGDPRLRQVCTGCGGSCQGVVVSLLEDTERDRVAALAARLGVERPITERGALRQTQGRCVFLDEGQHCRLHVEFGASSKPAICRQYPLVATKAGTETRLGIDPGCFSHATTWRGPHTLSADGLLAQSVPLPPTEERTEGALLELLSTEGMTLERFASVLAREPQRGQGWPPGLASRLASAAADPTLQQRLTSTDTSPRVRETVTAMLQAAGDGPTPRLRPQAYALDAMYRLVHLRLCHRIPAVVGVAALAVMGWVLIARLEVDEPRAGELFAGWSRALRAPVFWGTLLPDGQRLMTLLAGVRPS